MKATISLEKDKIPKLDTHRVKSPIAFPPLIFKEWEFPTFHADEVSKIVGE